MIRRAVGRLADWLRADRSGQASPPGLDTGFYREWYADLGAMSSSALIRHWRTCGSAEGRLPNFDALLASRNLDAGRVPAAFDWRVYLALYGDLGRAGLKTRASAIVHFLEYGLVEGRSGEFNESFYTSFYADLRQFRDDREAAIRHWLDFGCAEGRSPTLRHFACSQGLPADIVAQELETGTAWSDGEREAGWGRAAAAFSQVPPGLHDVWGNGHDDELFHAALASAFERAGRDDKAREIHLALALRFGPNAQIHESLADISVRASWREADHLKREQLQRLALKHYQEALHRNPSLVQPRLGVSRSLSEVGSHDQALAHALETLARHPESSRAESAVVERGEAWWRDQWADADALAGSGERDALYVKALQIATGLSDAHKSLALRGDVKGNAIRRRSSNGRVLLVADMFLPQCLRYRVEQKLEQLEEAGFPAKAVSWTDAARAAQELAFHDVVIFYRTPALPPVIHLISTARALGKATYFEIDDFVFDPEYPAPIETYGGYVSPGQYINLIKGGALFRAAAELCDNGIASTLPLAEHLGERVRSGRCFLHRNGLDSRSPLSFEVDVTDESHGVRLFYGSATYAHNSDFVEEALPAIAQVLEENPKTSLAIAGYLKLPAGLIDRFDGRIEQLPMTLDLQSYFKSMSKSHVNLAVLKPDRINDCKSELKWFEAGAMGIPAIVSPTRNYLDVVRHGEDALVAAGQEQWCAALRRLVGDAGERARIGNAARRRVLSEYSVEALAANLKSILGKDGTARAYPSRDAHGTGSTARA